MFFKLFKWFVKPWRWWIVVLILSVGLLYVMVNSFFEQNVRIVGVIFQFYGFALAVVDQHSLISKYGIPSVFSGADAWVKECPLRKGSDVIVKVEPASIKVTCGQPNVIIEKSNLTFEEKLERIEGVLCEVRRKIESNQRLVNERISKVEDGGNKSMNCFESRMSIIEKDLDGDRRGSVLSGRVAVIAFLFGTILTVFPVEISNCFGR